MLDSLRAAASYLPDGSQLVWDGKTLMKVSQMQIVPTVAVL
jgi:hypothetical protein